MSGDWVGLVAGVGFVGIWILIARDAREAQRVEDERNAKSNSDV